MKGPTPRRLQQYMAKCLGLEGYLRFPGDGRTQPHLPAAALLWALFMGALLRRLTFAGIEALVRSSARPYGPGDSEYSAGQRLLRRTLHNLGRRFADYVVVDGKFATAPFLHAAGEEGLSVIARLKDHLPERFACAQKRFRGQPPRPVFREGPDRVEIRDADDFDPWGTLRWKTVRVIYYRQHKPDGTVVEAYWLTSFPSARVSGRTLYRLAKSRWEIENRGFNDAKNRYGLEPLCHHEANSLLGVWLLICLALTVERLYRLRYLHRGTHPVRTAIALLLLLQLSLGLSSVAPPDSS